MSLSEIPRDQYEETLKAMRQRCYRAILSIGVQPNVANLSFPKEWAVGHIVRNASEAAGYTPERLRFKPTPKDISDMMPVLGAIASYKRTEIHGERDYQIIFARAHNRQWREIKDILGTTAKIRSLERWQDRAVEKIIRVHLTEMSELKHIPMRA